MAALGDSELYLALDELRAGLPTYDVRDHAAAGLTTGDSRSGFAELQQLHPAALAVVLGTNDVLDGTVSPDEAAALNDMATRFDGLPCVEWLEVPTTIRLPPGSAAAAGQWNQLLGAAAAAHHFEVVPWAAQVAAHPEWFGPDGLHFDDAGQQALASALAHAVTRCLSGRATP